MLSNMATSLIIHKRITTTLAKAKALRVYVEPLISRSKDDTTHSRRVVFSHLQSKEAVTQLFRDVSSKVADRPGGYTRIIKLGQRLGDNAEMAMIELVDFNVNLLGEKAGAKAKTTRRGGRRGTTRKADEAPVAVADVKKPKAVAAEKPEAPVVKETVAEELPAEEVADVAEETEPVAEAEEPVDEAPEEPASEAEPEEEPKA
jgi:large subunit ribosomal protein L17